MGHGPDQQRLDFNPIEATPEERERMRRLTAQWTLEEEADDFRQLPGETLDEFLSARSAHLRTIEALGVLQRPQSIAWEMIHGQRPPARPPRQLPLPFEGPSP